MHFYASLLQILEIGALIKNNCFRLITKNPFIFIQNLDVSSLTRYATKCPEYYCLYSAVLKRYTMILKSEFNNGLLLSCLTVTRIHKNLQH